MGALREQIRGLSVAIIKNKNRILVSPGYDKSKDEHFFRLIGGGIEFGETSLEALHREIKEELEAEIINCKLLTVIENIFTYNDEPYHEICFIYSTEFKNSSLYNQEEFKILDSPDDGKVIWLDIDEAKNNNVYPEGVKDLL